MILDNDLILSSAQAITDDAYADNVHDRGGPGQTGKPLIMEFRVETLFVSGGGATLQIEIRTSAALNGGDLDSNAVALVMSKKFTVAELNAADVIVWRVTIPKKGVLRYVQPYYEAATSTFSAGKIDAYIVPETEIRP